MELKFYINTTEIEEPIGFDDFKTLLTRHEYHGVGVESSIKDLEFYGVGYGIVQTAYHIDIDTELTFRVEQKCNGSEDFETLYEGKIDLSTYNEQSEDYCSCSCAIAEIGVKTTFNNRIETDVDLLTENSLDGAALGALPVINLDVPAKYLKYTSNLYLPNNTTDYVAEVDNNNDLVVSLPFGFLDQSELSTCRESNFPDAPNSTYSDLYVFKNNYDFGRYSSYISLYASGTAIFVIKSMFANLFSDLKFRILVTNGSTQTIAYEESIAKPINADTYYYYSVPFNINVGIPKGESISFIVIGKTTQTLKKDVYVKCMAGTNIELYSIFNEYPEDAASDMVFVDNVFKRVVKSISGLEFVSDWFNRVDSFGGGALKAISLGFWLRNALDIDAEKYKFPLSFKTLFESINAIDNIGWTFEPEYVVSTESYKYKNLTTAFNPNPTMIQFTTDISNVLKVGDVLEELGDDLVGFTASIVSFYDDYTAVFSGDITEFYADGVIAKMRVYDIVEVPKIRVERYNWFYKNDVILSINSPAKKVRKIDAGKFYTRLKCGYKNYAGAEDFNGVDTYHAESSYTTSIKALDKLLSRVSDFIADPFLIEYTRQKSFDKTTRDYKYDEKVFVFQLGYNDFNESYFVDNGVYNNNGSTIDPTPINTLISPAHNAIRHAEMFTKPLNYVTSPYNSKADISKYDIDDEGHPEIPYNNLEDSNGGFRLAEAANITSVSPILKPETIDFEYPLTKAEYDLIKANPYSIIQVDGEDTYLQEIQRSISTGLAQFKVIPKA